MDPASEIVGSVSLSPSKATYIEPPLVGVQQLFSAVNRAMPHRRQVNLGVRRCQQLGAMLKTNAFVEITIIVIEKLPDRMCKCSGFRESPPLDFQSRPGT